jgi:hypothetical protein
MWTVEARRIEGGIDLNVRGYGLSLEAPQVSGQGIHIAATRNNDKAAVQERVNQTFKLAGAFGSSVEVTIGEGFKSVVRVQ